MTEKQGNNKAKKSTAIIKLIGKEEQYEEKDKILLEITYEGIDYLNQWNYNLTGIISLIGSQDSDKYEFSNIIISDKDEFDSTEKK